MGYDRKIREQAKNELDRRRHAAEASALERAEAFYSRCPEAREIQESIAANAAGAAKAVVRGGDVRSEMERLHQRARELNARYDALLAQAGLTRQDLSPRYACSLCKDTGVADGRMCSCLKQLQRSLAYQQLSMSVPLERSTFDTFSLDFYKEDPRAYRQMSNILQTCKSYAEKFRANSPSFLFKGGTGLGKTHLSLAIAGAVIEKGFGVIYGSAQSFAVSFEKERFERRDSEDFGDTHSQLLNCDLLILDDLGTEFPSAYVNAALYDIINVRMLANRPTIISTNLSMKELEERYSSRLASRIGGAYGKLEFLGNDVRVELKKQKRSSRQ